MIRWAAKRLIAGDTMASVAREFDARSIPHVKNGEVRSPNHIRSIVNSPAVAGLRPGPDGVLVRAIWEPILPRVTWERVGAVLVEPCVLMRKDGIPYRTARRRFPGKRHLLSAGITVCGVCGVRLAAQMTRRPPPKAPVLQYYCNPDQGGVCVGIVGHRLEPFVVESLLSRASEPWLVELFRKPTSPMMQRVSVALERVEVELAHLAKRHGTGELLMGEWMAARDGLAGRAHNLRDQQALFATPSLDADGDLPAQWSALSIVDQRAVIATAFERIEVGRSVKGAGPTDRIKLIWRDGSDATASFEAPRRGGAGLAPCLVAPRILEHDRSRFGR